MGLVAVLPASACEQCCFCRAALLTASSCDRRKAAERLSWNLVWRSVAFCSRSFISAFTRLTSARCSDSLGKPTRDMSDFALVGAQPSGDTASSVSSSSSPPSYVSSVCSTAGLGSDVHPSSGSNVHPSLGSDVHPSADCCVGWSPSIRPGSSVVCRTLPGRVLLLCVTGNECFRWQSSPP